MKKLFMAILFACLMMTVIPVQATVTAPTFTLPLIEWGLSSFSPNMHYTASNGILEMTGVIHSYFPLNHPGNKMENGTVSIKAKLFHVEDEFPFLQGYFGTLGTSGFDVEIRDRKDKLALGGDIQVLTYNGLNGLGLAFPSFYFKPKKGYLKNDFLTHGPLAGGVSLSFNISPLLSLYSFDEDFTGYAEGKIGATPEPGTIILLGSGLLGLGVVSRIRRKRKQS